MSNITITDLRPTDSRKSFYGKARVVDSPSGKSLVSYSTLVATVRPDGKVERHSDWDSATTRRHVKAFCDTYAPGMDSKTFWKIDKTDAPVHGNVVFL